MQLFQIHGFQDIDATGIGLGDRMPDTREHLKIPQWNNTRDSHVYKTIIELLEQEGVDLKSLTDTYLESVNRKPNSNSLQFKMNTNTILEAPLGRLAWLDNVPELSLPGDTRVLFDDNGSIGGRDSMVFDKTSNNLKLSNFKISSRDTNYSQTYRPIIQQLGDRSLLLNHSYTKIIPNGSVLKNNIGIGEETLRDATNLENVVAIGTGTAKILNNTIGGVYIGNAAGSHSTESHRLYIDDEQFANDSQAKIQSLLYGEFDNDYLLINGKLASKEEVQIGDFTRSIAKAGMLAMTPIPDDIEEKVRPRFYNNVEWVYLDNNLNYHLVEVNKHIDTVVGTTSDLYKLNFVVDGYDTIQVQLGANAFNSTPIRSAHGDNTRIQLSNGSGDFISYSDLTYNSGDKILNVGRAIKLPHVLSLAESSIRTEGTFVTNDNHAYAFLNGEFRRLDNEPSESGVNNDGDNIGGSYEVYVGKQVEDQSTFEFRTLSKGRFMSLEYTTNLGVENGEREGNEITITNDYDLVVGHVDDAGIYTITKEEAVSTNLEASRQTLNLRKFKSTDGSITFSLADDDYIDLSAVMPGGGETNDAENLGTGIQLYKDKVGVTLRFKTLGDTDYISFYELNNVIYPIVEELYSSISSVNTPTSISIIEENTYLNENDSTKKLVLSRFKAKANNGLKVSKDASDIMIENERAINRVVFQGNSWNVDTKELSWNANYNSDIRDGNNNDILTKIGSVKIGANLTYNPATNTLIADDQNITDGDKLDDVVSSIVYIDEEAYGIVDTTEENTSRIIKFINASGTEIEYEGLGYLAFQDRYRDATIQDKGVVQIGDNINIEAGVISIPIANANTLGLIKGGGNVTIGEDGSLNINAESQDAVLYNETQYFLTDEDVDNYDPELDQYDYSTRMLRRTVARGNIGAAYVNGNLNQPFNTSLLSTYQNGVKVSQLGAFLNAYNVNTGFIRRNSIGNATSSMLMTTSGIDITLDEMDMSQSLNIRARQSNGTLKTVARFSLRYENEDNRGLVADLDITGNINYRQDI